MNDEEFKTLLNIVDKLEKRIFLLEKVLASHAKCIGQLREEKKDDVVNWRRKTNKLKLLTNLSYQW